MFSNKKESKPPAVATYVPGLYTSAIMLENKAVNVEVVVDKDHINSIRLTDLDPAVATLNPALVPTLQDLELQLVNDTTVDNLSIKKEAKHTSSMLVNAIQSALDKAKPEDAKNKK